MNAIEEHRRPRRRGWRPAGLGLAALLLAGAPPALAQKALAQPAAPAAKAAAPAAPVSAAPVPASPAAAATQPAPVAAAAKPAVQATKAAELAGEPGQVILEGFRSARFGMTLDEVKAAIAKDFGLKPEAIKEGVNTAERTKLLTVSVPNVLPEGGTAQVSYVFGYRSDTLIQVGVLWSPATDAALNKEKLYANGDVLAAHFNAAGYVPASVRTGLVLKSGIVLFRGADAKGRTTILLLQGQFNDQGGGQQTLVPSALTLLYAADAENPDVFKIAPGQF